MEDIDSNDDNDVLVFEHLNEAIKVVLLRQEVEIKTKRLHSLKIIQNFQMKKLGLEG